MIRFTSFAIVVAFCGAPFGPALAQKAPAGGGTSLYELYQFATEAPSIKAARAARRAAAHSVGDAWFGLVPRAQILHEKQRVKQEVLVTENPVYQAGVGEFRNYGRTLEAVWPIFDARAVAQLGVAYAASRRSTHVRTLVEQKVIYQTIEAYLLALAAIDSHKLASAEVYALQERSNEIKERLARGLGNTSEQDEAEARLQRARAQQIAALTAVGEAYAAIRRVSGEDLEYLYMLRGRIPMARPDPSNPVSWVRTAYEGNPELKALEETAKEAQSNMYKALAINTPRLEMRYTDNYLNAGGSLYGGGAKTDEKTTALRLTIPLFNPDNQGYPVFAARERFEESKYNVQDRRRVIEEKIRNAYLETLSNAQRDPILVKAADHQKNLVAALRERFKAGLGTTNVILDAERDSFRAQREVLSGRYNYLLNLMLLKQLAGVISVDDVIYVNSLLDTKSRPVSRVSLR